MLRNSRSTSKNKTEKEWHIVVKEQIKLDKTKLLKQFEAEREKM